MVSQVVVDRARPGAAPAPSAAPASGTAAPSQGHDPALLLDNARRLEIVLCRFRYAVAALALVIVAERRSAPAGAMLMLAIIPALFHAVIRVAAPKVDDLAAARRLGAWVMAADTALAVGVYIAFLRDPAGLPAAFMPLLVFEIVARHEGWAAAVTAAAIFAAAVGVRVYYQLAVIKGGSLRWPLLLVWVLLAALILIGSRELRAQTRARLAAQESRAKVAESFQVVVGELLTRSGVPPTAATWDDVLNAVRLLCDEQPAECAELATSIADLLAPAAQDSGLTRREREIVRLLATGYSYDRIARSLYVSGSTVRNHMHNIRSKLGLSSREEVIAFAQSHGLAPARREPAGV